MNNPFENKAIKFATEEELNHLAELARGYGVKVANHLVEPIYTYKYFRMSMAGESCANFISTNDLPEIPYSDFIASLEPMQGNHTEQQPDPIARPEHYRKCGIEPFQIWRELSLNGFMGDALKYLMRLGYKDAKINELKKCIRYLKWEIENVELGIMQFTPKDAKCSVSADVIAKELGMSPFIYASFHILLNLHTIENKVAALNLAIDNIKYEIELTKLNVIGA